MHMSHMAIIMAQPKKALRQLLEGKEPKKWTCTLADLEAGWTREMQNANKRGAHLEEGLFALRLGEGFLTHKQYIKVDLS